MGKDSLIKSTTKKSAKKEAAPKKKASKKPPAKKSSKPAVKAKKATAKKKSPSKAAPKKTKVAAKPKPKPKTASKPKKATQQKVKSAVKKSTKKLTLKELLFKSFGPISKVTRPEKAVIQKQAWPSAPPLIHATDPEEITRIKGLLFKSYDMTAIKAAAKPPSAEVISKPAAPIVQKGTAPIGKSPEPETVVTPTAEDNPIIITDLAQESGPDPISKAVKLFSAGLGIIVLLLLMISYANSSKYYIEPKDNAIEIWKGRFSPKDTKFFMVLHGTPLPGKVKPIYTKAEVFPLIFTYYLDKADTLLEVPGLPDFEGIKTYLHDAKSYAVSSGMHKSVGVRLKNIDRMILLYKADVSISKGTAASLNAAIKHLTTAQTYLTNTAQEQEIQQKLSLARSLKDTLKNKAVKKK